MSSIFTKIIQREIPAHIEYEDESVIVIHDIAPKAKNHLLIIPKKEIESIEHLSRDDAEVFSHMAFVAQIVARKLGIDTGYQLHINVGELGGQEVMHLHMHLLSDIEI